MKKTLLAVIGLALLPLPAVSQEMPQADDRGSYDRGSYDRNDHGNDASDWRDRQDDGHWGHHFSHNMYRDSDRDEDTKGAFFRLRNGDATVMVRCDPRETMRACVEATTMLLDRAARARQQTGGGMGSGPSGGQGTSPGMGQGGPGDSSPQR